jgi:carbamoyltransferase
MTQRIGLTANEDEYILMGMAAYGDSRVYRNQIMHDFFESKTLPIKFKHNLHRGCNWWRPELNDDRNFNIAAGTQWVYETILDNILQWCKQNTDSKNLVIMGGCALNCSANHLAYKYFDDVWIMPNPGDAGSAIGSVLAYKKEHLPMPNMYMGYNIEGEYPVEEAISELKKTGIVGVANGRAEFGPRAFGNRSLLADPRGTDIKQRVNDIKQRQNFRPFAPAVLSEHYDANFEGPANSYMQFTSRCKNPNLYPAIVHYDGTSRVQVVQKDDSGIRRLLERWYEETGCPMLLNTSLNIKGKPMVNDLTNAQEFAIMYNIKVLTKANND